MGCIETGPIYNMYYISHCQYQCFLINLLWGCHSGAVGSVNVWCNASRWVEVVGSNLAGGEIFTVSVCSVDLLYMEILPVNYVNKK